MALNRQEKAAVIEEITGQLASAQAVVVAEYRGLSVESVTQLRKDARAAGVYLRVLKNTLAKRAIAGTAFEGLSSKMAGPLITVSVLIPLQPPKCWSISRTQTTSSF